RPDDPGPFTADFTYPETASDAEISLRRAPSSMEAMHALLGQQSMYSNSVQAQAAIDPRLLQMPSPAHEPVTIDTFQYNYSVPTSFADPRIISGSSDLYLPYQGIFADINAPLPTDADQSFQAWNFIYNQGPAAPQVDFGLETTFGDSMISSPFHTLTHGAPAGPSALPAPASSSKELPKMVNLGRLDTFMASDPVLPSQRWDSLKDKGIKPKVRQPRISMRATLCPTPAAQDSDECAAPGTCALICTPKPPAKRRGRIPGTVLGSTRTNFTTHQRFGIKTANWIKSTMLRDYYILKVTQALRLTERQIKRKHGDQETGADTDLPVA
ncbi:hypothetical protein DL89DRAFT_264599, partial [Linderina pennispora]